MKRLNLVFSIFAVALMLSLFGCSGASDDTTVEPTQPPVTQQLLLSTVEPTPTPTPAAGSSAVFISKWGTQGTGDGQFREPEGVAVASDGSVYVADTRNHCIQKFLELADRSIVVDGTGVLDEVNKQQPELRK